MTNAEARRAKKREEYAKHRDRYLAYMRDYQRRKPEVNRVASRRYRAANPEKRRDTILRNQYQMSLEEFRTRIERQQGRCVSCGGVPRRWYVDHDHKCCPTRPTCGRCTRGLVCNGCNTYDRMSEPWVDTIGRPRGRKVIAVDDH